MSSSRRVKSYREDKDVLEATRERLDDAWENFDELWISFSGGKDSGACLNSALDAYERHGELPGDKKLQVVHFDDEFAYPETEDYVDYVAEEYRDLIHIWWLCFPMQYGGGTNRDDKYFTPWNPAMKDRWIRQMPDPDRHPNMTRLTRHSEWYQGKIDPTMRHAKIGPELIEDHRDGRAISFTGIRAAESMNRYTAIMKMGGWRKQYGYGADHQVGYPVYDWKDRDLWAIHEQEDWEYNKAYDKLQQLGYKPAHMRTAHPFHYMSLNAGDDGAEAKTQRNMWPEEYEKWIRRMQGAQLAFDYGPNYAGPTSPRNMTNEEYTHLLLEDIDDEDTYQKCLNTIQDRLERHASHSNEPLRQWRPCPVCDMRWWNIVNYVYEQKHEIVLKGQT